MNSLYFKLKNKQGAMEHGAKVVLGGSVESLDCKEACYHDMHTFTGLGT